MKTITHWIDGRLVPGTSGRSGPVYNPATGEQSGSVTLASADEVRGAVEVARKAAAEWATTSLSTRASILFRFRDLLDRNCADLAALVTAEHGKVLSDAAGEVARGLENVEFACGIPHLLKGTHSTQVSVGVDVHTGLHPLGVVAGITPFNFPVMVPLWMLANAIACGNAFILKPSEKDPSPSLLLAELLNDAGVPDGVFTVLQGDSEAVDALLVHPDVAAISFVGSTPVARHIYEVGTQHGKRVQALGGAKNHMVVLPDADIDAAADAAISAGYGSAGERCMAISVVVAVGDVADPLVEAIAARIPSVSIGPGTDPDSQMGPLVTEAHRDRVRAYVDGAEGEGASLVVDGRGEWPEGFFLGCTLLDRVQPGMTVYDDEIFGPVLERGTGRHLRRGCSNGQCQSVWKRRRCLHARRWRRPAVRARCARWHGRDQCGHPGTRRLPFLRRLEVLIVRRQRHVWTGGNPLLYPPQGGHLTVARPVHQRGRPRFSPHPLEASGPLNQLRGQEGPSGEDAHAGRGLFGPLGPFPVTPRRLHQCRLRQQRRQTL